MHQYSRSTPWGLQDRQSQTNPTRSNNDRDQHGDRDSGLDSLERATPETTLPSSAERAKTAEKIRQVTQNFFKRAALAIVDSRVSLAPSYNPDTKQVRSTKWFQMILDDSDVLLDDIADWVYVDVNTEKQPKALYIEIYLDIAEVTRNQTLVLVDERRKKWDVCEVLRPPVTTAGPRRRLEQNTEVVLERWKIWLGEPPATGSAAANEPMPNVYKKAVVLFRSLFTYCRFLPTWQFIRRIAKEPATLTALRPMYRIVSEERAGRDLLTSPLYPSAEPTCNTYRFTAIKSPAGAMNIEVTYRKNCNFRIDTYESLMSSQIRHDEPDGLPRSSPDREMPYLVVKEVGSLPVDRLWHRDQANQAYGSLSTFHQAGVGTSPMSALQAAQDVSNSPTGETSAQRIPPDHRTSQSSKSSLRSEGVPQNTRRVSVSFQPFKAGSLSSSPGRGLLISPSPEPSSSISQTSDISKGLAQARNRPSLFSTPQTALRAAPQQALEVAPTSPVSSSPKVPSVSRYSSSFGHRRSRFSSSGGSVGKGEDDNNSSGKGSQSSSKRGSMVGDVEVAGGSGSSGSMQTDDDNISDFLTLLETKKDLKSFNRTDDASRDASGRRTATALSKYRGMRESNAALGESISSSMMMHRSSNSSSQRLSGVPPTLVGASVSTSSSPGKPISPHTPHTPAIPSRLSEQSTIRTSRHRTRDESIRSSSSSPTSPSDNASDSTAQNPAQSQGATAIPIPTSPQRFPHHIRRSSSAHQRRAAMMPDLQTFHLPPGPSSLPLEDRERGDLSLSELLHASSDQDPNSGDVCQQRGGRPLESSNPAVASPKSGRSAGADLPSASPSGPSYRPRLTRNGSGSTGSSFGRGSTGRFSVRPGTTTASGSASGSGTGAAPGDDDEPLLFTMSELGRRSLEDVNISPGTLREASSTKGGGNARHGRREGW